MGDTPRAVRNRAAGEETRGVVVVFSLSYSRALLSRSYRSIRGIKNVAEFFFSLRS